MIDQGVDGSGSDVRVAVAAEAILPRGCIDDLKFIDTSGDGMSVVR